MKAKYSPKQDLILWTGSKAIYVKVDKVIIEETVTEKNVTYKLKNRKDLVKEELLHLSIDSLIESVSNSIKDNYTLQKTNS